jgi:hydroxyacylglutathione hydrolase
LIFLTHIHDDHTGSVNELKKYFNVPVVNHFSETKYFKEDIPLVIPETPYPFFNKLIKNIKTILPKTDVEGLEKEDDLKKYGIDFKITNIPAHSKGNLILKDNLGNCIIGDLVIGGFSSLNSPQWHLFYESYDLINQSIKILVDTNCDWHFPGHGLPYNKESLHNWIKNKNITF